MERRPTLGMNSNRGTYGLIPLNRGLGYRKPSNFIANNKNQYIPLGSKSAVNKKGNISMD